MTRYYFLTGWRLNKEQREAIKDKGFHIYANRSWDEGDGCTLEHRVIVNHESDVITNWEALDDTNPEDYQDDFYEYMDLCEAEDDNGTIYDQIKDILNW